MAKSKARDITEKTIKRLYALSGNQCAFPNCPIGFLNGENETNFSNVCHIEAAEPGGQRYNSNSDDDFRRSYENLILLCANHHIETNDTAKYSETILQEMKRNHEDKILQLISRSNILAQNPSALNIVIGFVGKRIFEITDIEEPINAPNTDYKITYNNVIRFKHIIEEYAVFQGKLNTIYKEIEKEGSTKKEFVLQNIKTIYLKEKGKYKDIYDIRAHADIIIENVEKELWKIIDNTNNPISNLPIEAIEISLLVILVDAFMRCNILEEPPKL
jgi:hypothetical protein